MIVKSKKSIILFITICIITLTPLVSFAEEIQKDYLQIGDYIEFGRYQDRTILWRIINIDEEGSPLLLSDEIIMLKPFNTYENPINKDANPPTNQGGAFWGDSTLREWLNSTDEKVEYRQMSPVDALVSTNSYAHEKGFLSRENFTHEEVDLIKSITHKTILNEQQVEEGMADGGEEPYLGEENGLFNGMGNYDSSFYKNVTDKVFLLSDKEMYEYVIQNQDILGDFYKGYPRQMLPYTTQAVPFIAGMNPLTPSLNPNRPYSYWLRTPGDYYLSDSIKTYAYYAHTGFADAFPQDGLVGVRPALSLKHVNISNGKGTRNSPYRVLNYENQVEKVRIDVENSTMRVGEAQRVFISIYPIDSGNGNITLKSDNTNVVDINIYGDIEAISAGKATIYVTMDGDIVAETTITVAPKVTAKGLKIGDYIQLGKYGEEPILWRIIHINEDGNPMLFADRILSIRAFDTRGPNAIERDDQWSHRKLYGSNFWGTSAIRQWLNSDVEKVEYLYNEPIAHNMFDSINAYADEAGFLSERNFTVDELDLIQYSSNKTLLSQVDVAEGIVEGGQEIHKFRNNLGDYDADGFHAVSNYDSAYHYTVTDRVFLLSIKEVSDYIWNNSLLEKNYYRTTPTYEAVINSDYEDPSLAPERPWDYWLRTPVSFTSYGLRIVNSYGEILQKNAHDGRHGIRPAVVIQDTSPNNGAGTNANPYIINEPSTNTLVNAIELSKKEITLYRGDIAQLYAQVLPNNATNQKIIWTSEDTSIVDVSQDGRITAISPGETQIVVATEDGQHKEFCKVLVRDQIVLGSVVHVNNDYRNIGINKIASNGEQYVAAGNGGHILYSEDSENWEVYYTQQGENIKDILWDGNRFVALGDNYSIHISSNGKRWTKINSNLFDIRGSLLANFFSGNIIFTDYGYMAFAGSHVYRSQDLIEWELLESFYNQLDDGWVSVNINDVYHDGETIVVVGGSRDGIFGLGFTAISQDGTSWIETKLGVGNILTILKDKEKFMIYNDIGDVYISEDGLKWEQKEITTDTPLEWFASVKDSFYKNEKYYALINNSLFLSNDGFHWEKDQNGQEYTLFDRLYITENENILLHNKSECDFYYRKMEDMQYYPIRKSIHGDNYIAYGNDIYVIVNTSGNILTSSDGISWTENQISFKFNIKDMSELIFVGDRFIIFENKALRYLYSEDGVNWKEAYIPDIEIDEEHEWSIDWELTGPTNYIVADGELILSSRYHPYVWRSMDGVEWDTFFINNENIDGFTNVKYDNGLYIAEDPYKNIIISRDFQEWQNTNKFPIKVYDGHFILDLAVGEHQYIALLDDSRFKRRYALSSDGINWTVEGLDLEGLYGGSQEWKWLNDTATLETIKWDGEKYIALLGYRKYLDSSWYRDILVSTDGYKWDVYSLPISSRGRMYTLDDYSRSVITEDGIIFVSGDNTIVLVEFLDRQGMPSDENKDDDYESEDPEDESQSFYVWETQYDVAIDKEEWTILFNMPVDTKTIGQMQIYITDEYNNELPVDSYFIGAGGHEVKIKLLKRYDPHKMYTLWIKDLKSGTGTSLKQNIKMDFYTID